jgi:hypothetical protein
VGGRAFIWKRKMRAGSTLAIFDSFCDSISITNSASPLNGFPPGQGLKSGGNKFGMVASTIQFLTADANNGDPKKRLKSLLFTTKALSHKDTKGKKLGDFGSW